ncbi:MAG: hypothetical protein HYW48_01545 [Deltaproteobacteria bacterium]|nr:hypothetical protein [Deltaproteobacteria bacterium]
MRGPSSFLQGLLFAALLLQTWGCPPKGKESKPTATPPTEEPRGEPAETGGEKDESRGEAEKPGPGPSEGQVSDEIPLDERLEALGEGESIPGAAPADEQGSGADLGRGSFSAQPTINNLAKEPVVLGYIPPTLEDDPITLTQKQSFYKLIEMFPYAQLANAANHNLEDELGGYKIVERKDDNESADYTLFENDKEIVLAFATRDLWESKSWQQYIQESYVPELAGAAIEGPINYAYAFGAPFMKTWEQFKRDLDTNVSPLPEPVLEEGEKAWTKIREISFEDLKKHIPADDLGEIGKQNLTPNINSALDVILSSSLRFVADGAIFIIMARYGVSKNMAGVLTVALDQFAQTELGTKVLTTIFEHSKKAFDWYSETPWASSIGGGLIGGGWMGTLAAGGVNAAVYGGAMTGAGAVGIATGALAGAALASLSVRGIGMLYNNLPNLSRAWYPERFKNGLAMAEQIQKKHSGKKLVIVGSYLTGALAQYVGIHKKVRSFAFESYGVRSDLYEELEKFYDFGQREQFVTIANMKGNLIKDVVVGTIGNQYAGEIIQIPNPQESWLSAYDWFKYFTSRGTHYLVESIYTAAGRMNSFLTSCYLPLTPEIEKTVKALLDLANENKCEKALGTLVDRTELSLSGKNISNVSPLMSFGKLKSLDLSKNVISDIEDLRYMINLENLNLADNEVRSLDFLDSGYISEVAEYSPVIGNWLSRQWMHYSSMLPAFVPGSSKLFYYYFPKLSQLNLDRNEIQRLKPLASLANLTELSINGVENISPEDVAMLRGETYKIYDDGSYYGKAADKMSSLSNWARGYLKGKVNVIGFDDDSGNENRLIVRNKRAQVFEDHSRPGSFSLALEAYPYALLSESVYRDVSWDMGDYKALGKDEYPESLREFYKEPQKQKTQPGNLAIDEYHMGLVLYKNDKSNEVVLVFRGLDWSKFDFKHFWDAIQNWDSSKFDGFEKNVKTSLWHFLGYETSHFEKAVEIAKLVQRSYPNKLLTITGSSLGGGLVQYAAIATGSRGIAFNSLGLNNGQMRTLSRAYRDNFAKQDRLVTIIGLQGDLVSHGGQFLSETLPVSLFSMSSLASIAKAEIKILPDAIHAYNTLHRLFLGNPNLVGFGTVVKIAASYNNYVALASIVGNVMPMMGSIPLVIATPFLAKVQAIQKGASRLGFFGSYAGESVTLPHYSEGLLNTTSWFSYLKNYFYPGLDVKDVTSGLSHTMRPVILHLRGMMEEINSFVANCQLESYKMFEDTKPLVDAIKAENPGMTCRQIDFAMGAQTSLALAGKNITAVHPIAHWNKLEEIDLSGNDIKNASSLVLLANVKKLNLADNKNFEDLYFLSGSIANQFYYFPGWNDVITSPTLRRQYQLDKAEKPYRGWFDRESWVNWFSSFKDTDDWKVWADAWFAQGLKSMATSSISSVADWGSYGVNAVMGTNLPNLEEVYLSNTAIKDIRPLYNHWDLKTVDLRGVDGGDEMRKSLESNLKASKQSLKVIVKESSGSGTGTGTEQTP